MIIAAAVDEESPSSGSAHPHSHSENVQCSKTYWRTETMRRISLKR
jgi:hypothetical protein